MNFERHPSEEAIERYSLGRLEPGEAADFEEHLLVCACCQDRLRDSDQYVRAMQRAASEVAGEQRRWTPSIWAAAAAAAGAAVLLLSVGLPERVRPAGAPATVTLELVRGGEVQLGARAPARRRLELSLDLTGIPALRQYHVRIVDARGRLAYETSADSKGQTEVTTGLKPGRYWVRVSESGKPEEPLREFGLEVN